MRGGLVVCLLFCVACGRSGSDVRSNSRFAAVPADSGDRNPVTSATGARGLSLRFDGQVARRDRIMEAEGSTARVFRFVNAGPSPVVIERATATCGCTVAEFSNKPVMQGDSRVSMGLLYSTCLLLLRYLARASGL
ncbi:MAG: DUF1573 domain-containing protein [Rikenellaceae bacterium]|nr:DUF1573 domain-containing protein [Rikenellaceae bacterium]